MSSDIENMLASKFDDGANVLRALSHHLRLDILAFIDEHKTINVNKIYNTLNLEQSITSQHLRILRASGLVLTQREGKFIHYSVNYEKIATLKGTIQSFLAQEA